MTCLNVATAMPLKVTSGLPKGQLPMSIRTLDLTLISGKLLDRATVGREKDHPPIPAQLIDQSVKDYRKFLLLNLKYQGFSVVPSYNIDDVWHQHILFTEKYDADTIGIFGAKLHHVPYFGRGRRNPADDERILNNTRSLWEKEFGHVPMSYDGMTTLTSDGDWSGNVDLSKLACPAYWEQQAAILASI